MTHQVAGEDDLGALLEEELDGGDGGADAGVIGDLLGVVERDVEVGAHEHLLPLEIRLAEGADAPLGRHITPLHAPPPDPTKTPREASGGSVRLRRRRREQMEADSDGSSATGGGDDDSPRVGRRTGSNRRSTRSEADGGGGMRWDELWARRSNVRSVFFIDRRQSDTGRVPGWAMVAAYSAAGCGCVGP